MKSLLVNLLSQLSNWNVKLYSKEGKYQKFLKRDKRSIQSPTNPLYISKSYFVDAPLLPRATGDSIVNPLSLSRSSATTFADVVQEQQLEGLGEGGQGKKRQKLVKKSARGLGASPPTKLDFLGEA
jgi:hypothetical protein